MRIAYTIPSALVNFALYQLTVNEVAARAADGKTGMLWLMSVMRGWLAHPSPVLLPDMSV